MTDHPFPPTPVSPRATGSEVAPSASEHYLAALVVISTVVAVAWFLIGLLVGGLVW